MTSRYPQLLHVRWSDVDANQHVRHSAYADYAAQARLGIFQAVGFDMEEFGRLMFGPILFKEELVYAREVGFGATVRVETVLQGLSEDHSRWALRHFLFQEGDESDTLRVQVTVHGAWLDLRDRKLCVPPPQLIASLGKVEVSEEFAAIEVKTPVRRQAGQ